MLIFDFRTIGDKLHAIRKRRGLTQSEVAELAGLSDRTYADIERGTVNMRVDTVLRICEAFQITPDELFINEETPISLRKEELFRRLDACSPHEKETALSLLDIYLRSLQ